MTNLEHLASNPELLTEKLIHEITRPLIPDFDFEDHDMFEDFYITSDGHKFIAESDAKEHELEWLKEDYNPDDLAWK